MSDSLRPHGLYSPWDSPGQNSGVGGLSLLQRIFPTQGSNPDSPTLQVDSLPAEPPGKPMNSGVGSLSLLQGIFPTQELNQGLLHCRQILYQLSYQGSPIQNSAIFFFFNKDQGSKYFRLCEAIWYLCHISSLSSSSSPFVLFNSVKVEKAFLTSRSYENSLTECGPRVMVC